MDKSVLGEELTWRKLLPSCFHSEHVQCCRGAVPGSPRKMASIPAYLKRWLSPAHPQAALEKVTGLIVFLTFFNALAELSIMLRFLYGLLILYEILTITHGKAIFDVSKVNRHGPSVKIYLLGFCSLTTFEFLICPWTVCGRQNLKTNCSSDNVSNACPNGLGIWVTCHMHSEHCDGLTSVCPRCTVSKCLTKHVTGGGHGRAWGQRDKVWLPLSQHKGCLSLLPPIFDFNQYYSSRSLELDQVGIRICSVVGIRTVWLG